jgi:hypothetical protein
VPSAAGAFKPRISEIWQPHVEATSAGIIYCAEPLFATAFALFLPVPLGQWLGIEYANDPCTCSSAAV